MARKKKEPLVINQNELTPTVLHTIEEKKSSLFGIIFLFVVFIAVVYFLPDINKYVDKYLGKSEEVYTPIVSKNNNTQEEVEHSKDYPFETNMVIEQTGYVLKNFIYANNEISFSVENKTNNSINLTNYYLEIFSNNTLKSRIKIDTIINGNETKYFKRTLKNTYNVTKLQYGKIEVEDYSKANLKLDEVGNSVATCSNDYNTIKYVFLQNSLVSLNDEYRIEKTHKDYVTLYKELETKNNELKNYQGYNLSFTSDISTVVLNINVNLQLTDPTKQNDIKYYQQNTKPEIVVFEMESRGYECI